MSMAKHCPLCSKRVLSHSRVLKCTVCNHEFHIACCNFTAEESADRNDWYCPPCLLECVPFCNIIEEDEYKSAIYSRHSDEPIDFSILDRLAFNPFEWNQDTNTPLGEVDPDIQYFSSPCFSSNQNCDYHTECTFNRYTTKYNLNESHGISLYCHNVHSLAAHDR